MMSLKDEKREIIMTHKGLVVVVVVVVVVRGRVGDRKEWR
jgi:hypothetical protein